MAQGYTVFNMADVRNLPTRFETEQFEQAWSQHFTEESDATVHSLINYLYFIRRYIRDYSKEDGNKRVRRIY